MAGDFRWAFDIPDLPGETWNKVFDYEISKDVKIDIVEYKYTTQSSSEGTIKLRVEADSFDTIEKLKNALSKIKSLKDVEEKSSDSKPGTDLKIAAYEMTYVP